MSCFPLSQGLVCGRLIMNSEWRWKRGRKTWGTQWDSVPDHRLMGFGQSASFPPWALSGGKAIKLLRAPTRANAAQWLHLWAYVNLPPHPSGTLRNHLGPLLRSGHGVLLEQVEREEEDLSHWRLKQVIFKLLLCLKVGSYLALNLSIYSGHLSKSANIHFSITMVNSCIVLYNIQEYNNLFNWHPIEGHLYCFPFFFGCDNHAAVNIPAKTISELNKEGWLVRRKTVSFSLGRRIGADFTAHMKCELDLIVRYRDYEMIIRKKSVQADGLPRAKVQRQESMRCP